MTANDRHGPEEAGTEEAGTGEAGTGESGSGEAGSGEAGTGEAAKPSDDVAAILDDMDEALEDNPEEIIRSYVQEGGQ